MQIKLKQLTALAACSLFLAGSAGAQQPPAPPNPRRSPDEALKTILDLSDAQLQQLKDLRESVNQKRQENQTEIRRLQQKQRDLLQTSPPDKIALADILVQQEKLRKQIEDQNKAFRDTALTLLTASQKEKVAQIQAALQLVRDAGPLAQFGLIEGPGGPGGGFIAGPGAGRFPEGGRFEAPLPPPGR